MKQGVFMLLGVHRDRDHRGLFVTLFFGGYNLPWLNDSGFAWPGGATTPESRLGRRDPARDVPGQGFPAVQLPDPRALVAAAFRWDQLLRFAWKFMLPLSLVNLVATVLVLWALQS
jgi:NADH-quinone oxidoreductase subunit H